MGVEQEVERAVDRQGGERGVSVVVGALEQETLPPLTVTAGQGRAATCGDSGDPLAFVTPEFEQAGRDAVALPPDSVGMKVHGEASSLAHLVCPLVERGSR